MLKYGIENCGLAKSLLFGVGTLSEIILGEPGKILSRSTTVNNGRAKNFVVEGLLSITGEDFPGRFEYFTIGEGMKYDEEAKQRDIVLYGLYTYEEFSEYLTEEQFYAFNGPYFKVLVGRGILTYEDILEIIRVNLYEPTIAE